MFGLLIVSHGGLAGALLESASEIVGPFEFTEALEITRQQAIDEVDNIIREAAKRVDQGKGVLILADMFGGTAANVALRIVGERNIEIVTGCNLPMLLKLSTAIHTATDLVSLAQLLKFYGQSNIVVASEILKEREHDA